tara:strand:- start:3635 stop:4987 length:1353 start_codon:yes stop_codon:yes gene_type:complete
MVMSYLFFILASGWHIILLLISTIVDWNSGNRIYKNDNKVIKKRWLKFSIIVNLSILAIFKYLDFIIRTLGWVTLKFGNHMAVDEFGIILPVGISFYTFQTMSYTIDIYREKQSPAKSFTDFACYAAFFPQLVAGPIVRYDEFRGQINDTLTFEKRNLKVGITLILYGLVKKMVFADNFALHADSVFGSNDNLDNTILIYWGALMFGMQIYCDFSAYSDIALGSAKILGINLPENFKTPYSSSSVQEFWRKWHISLSTWLRDYLYISLGGNRNGEIKMYGAIMITMILGGLWHGASWNFVLWGLLHGFLLVTHRQLIKREIIKIIKQKFAKTYFIFSLLITQWLIFLTWIIFRVEDANVLIRTIKSYLLLDSSFDFEIAFNAIPGKNIFTAFLALVFIIGHLLSSNKEIALKYKISNLKDVLWGSIVGIMVVSIWLFKPEEVVSFIYFRF